MKRILLSLVLALIVFAGNAQVGYLLTATSIAALPQEVAEGEAQQPEQNAANWFKTTYVDKSQGQFVSPAEVTNLDPSAVKVLWINIDRVGLNNLADAGISSDVINAVKAYVEKGGCLFLTKQANLIAYNIGRMGYAPGWGNGGYAVGGDVWSINAQLGLWPGIGQVIDRRSHAIYNGLTEDATLRAYDYEGQSYAFPTYPLVGAVARTDNNNMWVDLFRKDPQTGGKMEATDGVTHYDNGDVNRLYDFESDWACQVLAVWGHVLDFCAPGIIEFYPQGNFKGTILTNGFAAYQWGTANNYIGQVQLLTKNSLDYLLTKAPANPSALGENIAPALNGAIYNIMGQKIEAEQMQKGQIYIVNGAKVIYQ